MIVPLGRWWSRRAADEAPWPEGFLARLRVEQTAVRRRANRLRPLRRRAALKAPEPMPVDPESTHGWPLADRAAAFPEVSPPRRSWAVDRKPDGPLVRRNIHHTSEPAPYGKH